MGRACCSQSWTRNRLTFPVVGDTGASSRALIGREAMVADGLAVEIGRAGADGPAFLYHLGDVVYSFGEAQSYYERFRRYDRPIFAIPGNHDGAVYGPDSTAAVRRFSQPPA